MGIISWLIIGFLISQLWRLIFHTGKFILILVLGIIGAGLGGLIATVLGIGAIAVFALPALIPAAIGACLFLCLGRLLRGAH